MQYTTVETTVIVMLHSFNSANFRRSDPNAVIPLDKIFPLFLNCDRNSMDILFT